MSTTLTIPTLPPANAQYVEHRFDAFDSSWRPANNFREHVPPLGHPRTAGLANADVYAYSKDILSRPKPKQLFGPWYELLKKPFVGITSDGIVKSGLYKLVDECAPTQRMVSADRMVIDAISVEGRKKVICENVDSITLVQRKWCNTEIIFHDVGIRLEFLEQDKVDLVMGLLEVSLGEKGFEKALGAMKFNHFLGEIVHAKTILNHYSYQ